MDRSLVLLLHLNYDHIHWSSIATFSIIATLKLQTQKVELHLKKFQPEFLEHNTVKQCDLLFVSFYNPDDCG